MAHPTHPVWGFANQLAVGPHFGSRQRNGGGRGNMGGAHLKRAQGMSLDGDSYGFVLNFPFQKWCVIRITYLFDLISQP